MNQRLLARNVPPPGSTARTELLETLAEVFPETIDELEARLAEPAPWLVDVATPEEAERVKAWVEAASPARLTVVLAVGPRPPSRTAALIVLEQRLAERRAREAQAQAEEAQRRQAEARERARALASERRPSGPLAGPPPRRRSAPLPVATPAPAAIPEASATSPTRWLLVVAGLAIAGGALALARCGGDAPPATATEAR